MTDVTIYTTMFCPYCWRAKGLLADKGVAFDEIDVTMSPARRREMAELAGGQRSVPQIFIGDRHVGGSDELMALELAGKLDAMLGAAP